MSGDSMQGETVLITGVCGTVGQELLRQILMVEPAAIIGLDNNESELFLVAERYRDYPHVQLFIADLRDRDELQRRMREVNIVFHAAALKHVNLCERSPREAVQTNIIGTQNVIDAAIANGVSRMLFTSSDKAVNPTNVMGISKLMGERLVTAANFLTNGLGPVFVSTRFGNVMGSSGSVVPLFKQQIAAGGPVTLTDPEMTRFIMTLEEAVSLVMKSMALAGGGEVFVTKMPVARIKDLAVAMIEVLSPRYGFAPQQIKVQQIGRRPGEKLFEELLNEEETRRTVDLEQYFVVLPALVDVVDERKYNYVNGAKTGMHRAYNSAVEPPMSLEQLRTFLLSNHILDTES